MWIRAGCAPQTLERNWKTIRDEALAVMDQKSGLFVPEEENLREKGEWGQYTLWQQGRPAPGSALDAVSVLAQQPCACCLLTPVCVPTPSDSRADWFFSL